MSFMTNLGEKLGHLFEGDIQTDMISAKAYQRMIEDGTFFRKYVFGVTQEDRGPALATPTTASGAIFIGKMGSGKSAGARHTVHTMDLAFGDSLFIILLDPIKTLGDYSLLFDNENVSYGLGRAFKDAEDPDVKDISTIIAGISCAWDEYLARTNVMGPAGFDNILFWEKFINESSESEAKKRVKKNNPGWSDERVNEWYRLAVPNGKPVVMSYILLVIEEAHALMTHPNFDFFENAGETGTPAYKLKQLNKVGRSFGITTFAASQRVAKDIPTDLLSGLNNKLCFRPATSYDASQLGLEHANEIKSEESGKYACESGSNGYGQYPYMSDDAIKYLMEKYKKPYIGVHYGLQPKQIRDRMGNNSSIDEAMDDMTFTEVYANASLFPIESLATKYLKGAGYEVSESEEGAPYELIGLKNGARFAIKCVREVKQGHTYSNGMSKEKIDMITKHATLKDNCKDVFYFSMSKGRGVGGGLGNNEMNKDKLKTLAEILDKKTMYSEQEFLELVSDYPIFQTLENPKKKTKGKPITMEDNDFLFD